MFSRSFVFFIISLSLLIEATSFHTFLPQDATLDFSELLVKYGLPVKEYNVVTADGFIVALYRIPGTSTKKYPVLLMHGMLCSADCWVLRGNNSLPMILANTGFDVWIGNFRGTKYSRRHTRLDPNSDSAFWDFTVHELAIYDLAATIDTVLEKSGADKVSAIGHSLGNTIFYVLGSTKPEYNEKVNLAIALAPACFFHNAPPPVDSLLSLTPIAAIIGKKFDVHELFGPGPLSNFLRLLCDMPVIGYNICIENILFPFSGYDFEEFDPEFLPILNHHFPSSVSLKTIVHIGQIYRRKKFAQYDYELRQNRAVYNSSEPLTYDLSKVTMPIALIAAKNDRLSSLEDVSILRRQLANVVRLVVVPREKFNHLDYIWGQSAHKHLYPYILSLLKEQF